MQKELVESFTNDEVVYICCKYYLNVISIEKFIVVEIAKLCFDC